MIRRSLQILRFFVMIFTVLSSTSFAIQPFEIRLIVDPGLAECLKDLSKDHAWSSIDDVTEIECHGYKISSLKGLDQFSQLRSLSLFNNALTAIDIDLKIFKQMVSLNLARNQLTQVSLNQISKLETLYLFSNKLMLIELKNLQSLATLRINNNFIQHFLYENLPELNKVYIFNNKLEHIDIYRLPSLSYMDCRENPMPDELYEEMDLMEGVSFFHDGNAEDW